MKPGRRICKGKEFAVFELDEDEILKVPHGSLLKYLAFGNFRRKTEEDLRFLKERFSEFLPPTELVDYGKKWALRQKRIYGLPFSEKPTMTAEARSLLSRADRIYHETGRMPDILNLGNLMEERGTGRLYLVDVSVLGGNRMWPVGYLVAKFLAKVVSGNIDRWLREGFKNSRTD